MGVSYEYTRNFSEGVSKSVRTAISPRGVLRFGAANLHSHDEYDLSTKGFVTAWRV